MKIQEKLTLYLNKSGHGGQLAYKDFTKEENKKISEYVLKNFKENQAKEVLSQVENKDKYTSSLIVKAGSYIMDLYASYGVWRLGMGGRDTSSLKVWDKAVEAFKKEVFGK